MAYIWQNRRVWLVCGGRDFDDWPMVDQYLDTVAGVHGMPRKIVQGGARGADSLAADWAQDHRIESVTFFPDWKKYGVSAGPRRNQFMLDMGQPELAIAFPGGRGTADMVSRAKKAGVKTIEYPEPLS